MPMRFTIFGLLAAGLLVTSCRTSTKAPVGQPVRYSNGQYGLKFYLPADWEGFSVLTNQWVGQPVDPANSVEYGPVLVLRHPLWTTNSPREDIPIMVFTRKQWEEDHAEKFIIEAGGLDEEVSHNDPYVFAIWSRFTFDELPGSEEAGKTVEENQEMNRGRELYPW